MFACLNHRSAQTIRISVTLVFMTFLLPDVSSAGKATADSDWFFDSQNSAGGRGSNTMATNWSLGNNDATISGTCMDPKAKISGTKAALSGGMQQITSQCSGSDSTALGDSVMVITAGPGVGVFTVTPSADASATADGFFTTEAEAVARYEDPIAFTSILPDFIFAQDVSINAGSSISASGLAGDNAAISLSGFSDVIGLSTLYDLRLTVAGDAPNSLSCSFTSTFDANLIFVDDFGSPLSDSQIEAALCSAFNYDSILEIHSVSTNTLIFQMRLDLGTIGVSTALVGFNGENTASVVSAAPPVPAMSAAVSIALVVVLALFGSHAKRSGRDAP